jgi:transcriptional regulator with XRE-family HTH domain
MEYNFSNEISGVAEITGRIDSIRRQIGMNQEQLAAALGISQPAVSKYLKNRIPPGDILLKLAGLSNTTIEWILTGKKNYFFQDKIIVVSDQEEEYSVDNDLLLARKIAGLNPKTREVVRNLIDLLLTN